MFLEGYKNTVSTAATVVTIIQFLSGIDICRKIVQQGSTGEYSGFPFVGGTYCTSVWLLYGYIISDIPMKVTNSVGLSLQFLYLMIYLRYCIALGPWKTIRKQMAFFGLILGCILYYAFFTGQSKETLSTHIGLLCCVASIIFCLSPLASLKEVFQTKSSQILPFPLILSMFFVGGLWCLYGIIIENSFVMYPNLIGFTIAGFELLLFIVFPSTSKEKEPLVLEFRK